MPLVTDLERQHTLSEIAAGLEIERTFRVSGIIANPDQILLVAKDFAGIPALGDGYPGNPEYVARQKDVTPDGPSSALVVVTYSNRPGPTWNQQPPVGDGEDVKGFSSTVISSRTTVDAGDNPMTIPAPTSLAGWSDYLSEAQIFRPVAVLRFERPEQPPPSARVRTMVGTINSLQMGLYAAGTLLFSRLDANSVDGGRTYNCVYEFRYDPNLWVHTDAFHGPDGKVPTDATELVFTVYGATDFNALGLDFSDTQTPV